MNVTPLRAPTTEAPIHDSDCALHNEPAEPAAPCDCSVSGARLTPEQQKAQAVLDAGDYQTMIRESVHTLRSELYAAEFMFAELTKARDVQNRKKKFLRAAGKLTGLLPEFTDCALRLIQGQGK